MSQSEDVSLVSIPNSPAQGDMAELANMSDQNIPNNPMAQGPSTSSPIPDSNPIPNAPTSTHTLPTVSKSTPEWNTLFQMMLTNQNQLQNQVLTQQQQIQDLISNSQRNTRSPATFNNLLKFSDPNKFTGRPREVDSFVKSIEA